MHFALSLLDSKLVDMQLKNFSLANSKKEQNDNLYGVCSL